MALDDADRYVHLAFDEVRMADAGSPQVSRRLKAALQDLASIAPPDRRAVLDRQLELLESGAAASHEDDRDIRLALQPDARGIGGARAEADRVGPRASGV